MSRASSRRPISHNASISQNRQIKKADLRQAKIISSDIPHNVKIAPKFKSDGLDGCDEPRVVRRYQAKFGKQKRAGVEIVAVECGRKRLALGVPGALEHLLADALRNAAPMAGAVGQIEMVRDGCEALAACPAHRGRMGMHARAPTVFPDAGIGLERELRRLLAERLDRVKKRCIARPRQPAVEEHWRRGHDDAAIDIVLVLIDGRIADAHRSVAAIAAKRRTLCAPRANRCARRRRAAAPLPAARRKR